MSTEQPGQEAEPPEVPKELPPLDITRAETWPEMLTVEELASILRSSTKSVRDMIANGQIEAMRGAGRGFRISKRWVIAHILQDNP
ncbi:MAG: helix-turn-helix domain-containing protein [Microlunatus sp.]|nr:helix-turn-helix domain-containing protein [Microlunatus sp.]